MFSDEACDISSGGITAGRGEEPWRPIQMDHDWRTACRNIEFFGAFYDSILCAFKASLTFTTNKFREFDTNARAVHPDAVVWVRGLQSLEA